MTREDRRHVTVLVLGRPGKTTRRYRINLSVVTLLLLGLPLTGLAVGYTLGHRRAPQSAVAAASASKAHETVVLAARAAPPPPAALPAPSTANGSHAGASATREAAEPVAPHPAPTSAEPAPAGQPLRVVRGSQSQDVIEVDPFNADGSPRASAFERLQAALACGSGHSQQPEAALVRVLLEAQHNFAKPIVLLGGRCPAHDDHPDSIAQHKAGRAADVRVRGVSTEQLANWLVTHGVQGVGRYPRARFVHIDVRVGPREQWEAVEPAPDKPEAPLVLPAAQAAAPRAVEAAPTRTTPAEVETP